MLDQVNGVLMTRPLKEGKRIDYLASQFGLHQLINEPIHLLDKAC